MNKLEKKQAKLEKKLRKVQEKLAKKNKGCSCEAEEPKSQFDEIFLAKLASHIIGVEYPGDEYFVEEAPEAAPVEEETVSAPETALVLPEPEPVVAPVVAEPEVIEAPVEPEPVVEVPAEPEPVIVLPEPAPAPVVEEVKEEVEEEPAPEVKLTDAQIAQKLYDERKGTLIRDQFVAHVGTYLGIVENYNGLAATLYLKYGTKAVATVMDGENASYTVTMRLDAELGKEIMKRFDCVQYSKFPRSKYWFDVDGSAPANLLTFFVAESYKYAVEDAALIVNQKKVQYEENLENDDEHISLTKLLAHAATRQFIEVESKSETGSANIKFRGKAIAVCTGNNLNFKLNMRANQEISDEYAGKGIPNARAKFPQGSQFWNFEINGGQSRKVVENLFNDVYTVVRKESIEKK